MNWATTQLEGTSFVLKDWRTARKSYDDESYRLMRTATGPESDRIVLSA